MFLSAWSLKNVQKFSFSHKFPQFSCLFLSKFDERNESFPENVFLNIMEQEANKVVLKYTVT